MASINQQYNEQLATLQERFPQQPTEKVARLLRKNNGDVDLVHALLIRQEFISKENSSLEEKYGSLADTLQKEFPSGISKNRFRLLKIISQFGGEIQYVRKFLGTDGGHHHEHDARPHKPGCRREKIEELRAKYATQIGEIAAQGIEPKNPRVLRQLEKHNGDVNKVIEVLKGRKEKHQKRSELLKKYQSQIDQLRAENISVKNDFVLARLLEKAEGNPVAVKQLLEERREKQQKRKEYRQKHQGRLANIEEESNTFKKRRELSTDDMENLKRLRSAGIYGNPQRVLEMFHRCNESIEMTFERMTIERQQRQQQRDERMKKRDSLHKISESYIPLKDQMDWPANIDQVYLDGNNMMFVVDSLRRLCLNRQSHKTERALADLASAWNAKMHIPNVELIFDSTHQLNQVGTVLVSSARPTYPTTDQKLIELARDVKNQEKNKRTIIVTSDRALAESLKREGCQLVKPYHWFLHCMMVLAPDLLPQEVTADTQSAFQPATKAKVRHNFDELIQRVSNID